MHNAPAAVVMYSPAYSEALALAYEIPMVIA
jgi:hypothetical protein